MAAPVFGGNPPTWASFNLSRENKQFDTQMREFLRQLSAWATLMQSLTTGMLNGSGGGGGLTAADSVKITSSVITLVNDVATPTNGQFYGYSGGARGWFMGTPGPPGPTGPTGPTGPQGIQGVNANTTTTAPFTVPAVGSTVSVTVLDASWIVVGQELYVDTAGGGTGLAGFLQVTAKAGNTLTLLNPVPAPAIPLASSSQAGLLATLSGNATDYVGGDNASHNLVAALAGLLVPSGAMFPFGGSSAPTGFLLCDGTSYLRTTYPTLFTAIGTAFGSVDGTHFNVPDARGRTLIGAGAGTGLTSRVLAATGGEETHQLVIAEIPSHGHALGNSTPWATGTNLGVGASGTATSNTFSTGGGGSHNTMPPFLVGTMIIKI